MIRTRRAFTMAELMVVVSIIAILASILFPVFAQSREAARRATCRSNLHQIGIALHVYARDYDGRFPPREHDLEPLILPYLNQVLAMRCPSDAAPVPSRRDSLRPVAPLTKTTSPLSPGLMRLYRGDASFSYQYRAGRTVDDLGDLPVAADWQFRHHAMANVLYRGGEVRGLAAHAWIPFSRPPRPPAGSGAAGGGKDATPLVGEAPYSPPAGPPAPPAAEGE